MTWNRFARLYGQRSALHGQAKAERVLRWFYLSISCNTWESLASRWLTGKIWCMDYCTIALNWSGLMNFLTRVQLASK